MVARYKSGEEIVGDAARQFRNDVGSCGGDDQGVDTLGDGDVLDGAFDVGGRFSSKQAGDDFLPGQSGEGERRNELLRAARHHHLNFDLLLLQPPDQFGRLVGRYSSGNAERDAHH